MFYVHYHENKLLSNAMFIRYSCSVGKTMIVNRFSKDNCEVDTMPTIGTDFTIKAMKVDGRSVTLQVSERFLVLQSVQFGPGLPRSFSDIQVFKRV